MMWLLDSNALIKCLKHPRNADIFPLDLVQTTIFNVIEHPPILNRSMVSILYPTLENYTHSLEYALKLREKGTPLPAIDILIGTMAIDESSSLVTDDTHFDILRDVASTLKISSVEEYLEDIFHEKED